MLKIKSLAVWTSKAVWSPNSPCSSTTSSDTWADSWSRVAPDRKSTSDSFLAGAGERGATALIRDSILYDPVGWGWGKRNRWGLVRLYLFWIVTTALFSWFTQSLWVPWGMNYAIKVPIIAFSFERYSAAPYNKTQGYVWSVFRVSLTAALYVQTDNSAPDPSCCHCSIMLSLYATALCESWDFVGQSWRTIWYQGATNITF